MNYCSMPQLTIYLDAESERIIGLAARRESLSLSRWARDKLVLAAGAPAWPDDYASVIGSIADPDFVAPEDTGESKDQRMDFDA